MALTSKKKSAYLAGIVDGEGYLGIARDKENKRAGDKIYHAPVIKIAMCEKDFIKWLHDSFGGNIEHRKQDNENWADSWCWTLKGFSNVPDFLSSIYPYLRIKRNQADVLKKLISTRKESSYEIHKEREGRGGRYRRLKPEVIEYREELYSQIRILNKTGK